MHKVIVQGCKYCMVASFEDADTALVTIATDCLVGVTEYQAAKRYAYVLFRPFNRSTSMQKLTRQRC